MKLASRLSLSVFIALLIIFIAQDASSQPVSSDQPDVETYSSRYQLTYNQQYHPAFGSLHPDAASSNSLTSSSNNMYTLSLTAHWGAKVWSGGEVYFDPEMMMGVPFTTNLVGLGGFTNGEITRAAGNTPQFYRQRLFLRQTWGLGGAQEHLDGDFNQVANWVDKNRVVLTVGNFSILDVFDDNAYAKDPRTQFMNWGNWTYLAYDYAADARGFGWGFALEWYKDDWVYRYGRMTGPATPNGLAVDFALANHYGDQFEIERSYVVSGQPGKARVLLYHNRAVMANFDQASAYLSANPSASGLDGLAATRQQYGVQSKYGLGFNVEQALNDDAGVFMRVMHSDGKTETLAFAEADSSLSTGILTKGTRWGRAQDNVGVSFMRSELSAQRMRYLGIGGMSFFIGDGSDYTGSNYHYKPEDILESFYSYSLSKTQWLTFDYQYIRNPAYNADRGPVNVYAMRYHVEF